MRKSSCDDDPEMAFFVTQLRLRHFFIVREDKTMEYKQGKDSKAGRDDKEEPDYKSLYIDALTGLEEARRLINETIRECKSRVGGDWRLEWMQTHGVFTNGGKDLTAEAIKQHKEYEEKAYYLD